MYCMASSWISFLLCSAALLSCACSGDATAPVGPIDVAAPWTRGLPAAVGMDPRLTTEAESAAARVSRLRSLLVARHGRLVIEHYFGGADSTTTFDVRSVTKGVVSALTGIALSRGLMSSLDATVGTYVGPPYTLDHGDSAVTIADLLTMTSGYQWNETNGNDYNVWVTSPNRVQFLLDRAQTSPPGPFTYNSAAVHLLGVLVQRAAGMPLPAFADSVLFAPAGITSARWEPLDSGTVNGGSGIALTGRDLLRYGQLLLQDGRSRNRQIIPAEWVRAMTAAHFTWRNTVGREHGVTYGYLWWVADGTHVPRFFAWGYGGQFLYVAPDLDLVAVVTTAWSGLGAAAPAMADSALTVIVDGVLPAVR
jgi:CubicO group peptidase (beta-lactamase class C family)